MSTTAIISEVVNRLGGVLPAFVAPAEKLPTSGGHVVQSAVVWATTGRERLRADSAHRKDRVETFQVTCVGASSFEALAASEKVRGALLGSRLASAGSGSGRIAEVGFTGALPTVEPGTDPVRVSCPITFQIVNKKVGG